MQTVKIRKERYTHVFGGMGFHNNEAMLYPIIEKEHFDQLLCKCYRETAPGFMRTFAGYADWSRESMDAFCEYYSRTQKVTDTPIYLAAAKGAVHFSEEEMEHYCEKVADNLAYLKKEKGMNHLRYYCFSNEMTRGVYAALVKDLPTFKRYHQMLFRAFQNRDLQIGLLATDASGYPAWATMDWAIENMSEITEDYCLHIYERDPDLEDLRFYDFFYEKCAEKVEKALRNDGRRFILGEIGIQDGSKQCLFHKNVLLDVCRFYEDDRKRAYCALKLVEMAFAAINAGVFSLAYWSFTDYPDPYSCAYSEKPGFAQKWGRCERYISGTTDFKYNKWGFFRWEDDGDHSPREPWWAVGPMVKLYKRNSKVLTIDAGDEMLRCCGIWNLDGSVTVGIVNRHKTEQTVTLDTELFRKHIRVYEYDPQNVPYNRFGDLQQPSDMLDPRNPAYTLKPESITYFTTDYEEKERSVSAANVTLCDGKLTWDAVEDENHCYYRVYAGKTKNFKPTGENQIASTVACDLPVKNEKLHYKVLSVDQWGNV